MTNVTGTVLYRGDFKVLELHESNKKRAPCASIPAHRSLGRMLSAQSWSAGSIQARVMRHNWASVQLGLKRRLLPVLAHLEGGHLEPLKGEQKTGDD
jgi:hypothetical protein